MWYSADRPNHNDIWNEIAQNFTYSKKKKQTNKQNKTKKQKNKTKKKKTLFLKHNWRLIDQLLLPYKYYDSSYKECTFSFLPVVSP